MDFYVCDAEGNIIKGPFEAEQDAEEWLAAFGPDDGFTITTGACDVTD